MISPEVGNFPPQENLNTNRNIITLCRLHLCEAAYTDESEDTDSRSLPIENNERTEVPLAAGVDDGARAG